MNSQLGKQHKDTKWKSTHAIDDGGQLTKLGAHTGKVGGS